MLKELAIVSFFITENKSCTSQVKVDRKIPKMITSNLTKNVGGG